MAAYKCSKEKDINKINVVLFGDEKQPGIRSQLDVINTKLSQQPTTKGMLLTGIGMVGALVAGLVFVFGFLLNNQKTALLAETKLIVKSAITHTDTVDPLSNDLTARSKK